MENKSNKINYDYYAIAFIDVLGQSDAFRDKGVYIDSYKSPLLGNREEIGKRLLEAHKKTADVVQKLRDRFDDFIKSTANSSDRQPPPGIPQDRIEQYKKTVQPKVDLYTFSDCLLVSTCLSGEQYYGAVLTSVYYILIACEGMMLESLAIGKPFRGAIDVGMGTKLKNDEIYGPVSSRVYELERNIVQYPRIVIGDELINFFINIKEDPQTTDPQDAEYCRKTAENCLNRIKKDLDGVFVLDYLGKEAVIELKRAMQGEIFEDYYQRALKFIGQEYEKYKENKDQKLAQRYYMLRQYFIDSHS